MEPDKGYWIIVEYTTSLCLKDAIPIDPLITYNLHAGANLISFPYGGSILVQDAIAPELSSSFSGFIGEGVAASPNPILGWVGSLTHFKKGKGYWLKSDINMYFNFDPINCTESSSSLARINHKQTEKSYIQSTEQAFYFIEDIENIELGVIVSSYCNDTKVGSRVWNGSYTDIPAMGNDDNNYSAGYIKAGDTPTFKVYDASDNRYYIATPLENIPYGGNTFTSFIDSP